MSSYWSGPGVWKLLSGFKSRNDPEPNGTYPMFQEILRCLSVNTPTVALDCFDVFLFRLIEVRALVEGD